MATINTTPTSSPPPPQVDFSSVSADELTAKAVLKRYEGLVMVRTKAIKGKGAWYWAHLEPMLVQNTDTGLPEGVKLRCSLCDAVFLASNPSRTASEHLKRGTCPNFNSLAKPISSISLGAVPQEQIDLGRVKDPLSPEKDEMNQEQIDLDKVKNSLTLESSSISADELTAKAALKLFQALVMVRTKAIIGKGAWYWAHLEPILVQDTDTALPKAVKLRCCLCDAVFLASNPSRTASEHLKGGSCPNFNSLAKPVSSISLGAVPHINHNAFSPEEDEIIIRAHAKFGDEWATIARLLNGRTDNTVKNHWHTTLKKKCSNMIKPVSVKADDIVELKEAGLEWQQSLEGKGKATLDQEQFTPTVALQQRKAELALHELSMLPSSQIEGVDKAIINEMTFIWEAMDNVAKHCVKQCALYPKGEWIDKSSLISHWIKDHLVYSHDEGNFFLRSLTNAFLVEDYVVNHVRLNEAIYDDLVNLLVPKMHPMFLKQGDFEKTESMKEEEWNAKEIYLMDNELYELPESPNCPSLIGLYLQRNYDLTIIPPLFFDNMPVLQILDLSHTSIKSLPESLPKLVALRKLVLRGCELFMELSPQVGELNNLEELDLEETQIIYLPVEIEKLVKLKRLRASLYGDMNCSKKRLQSSAMIPTGVISNLSQLNELSIDVNPDDERWNATVEAIIEEVCSSKLLNTLSFYLPKVELLKKLGSTSLISHPSSRFSFVVGHAKRRIMSRVPDEVEARFKEWDKCLKFVNGWDIPDEITMVLKKATAFYVERNATAVTLSEFGIENMRELKLCILSECNEMQTIIGGGEFHEASDKEEEEDESYFDFEYDSDSSEEVVLESLLYLGIYYMNNLRSIWNGPIHKGSLSNLKFLVIHTCPKLSTIFSVDLLSNLMELEELIIEDCPQVTCLVSHASSNPASVDYLPSLRKVSLLFLPELVNISGGLNIAPKLERIGFYYCPKLENLSKTELSSKNLKVIKGERKWWDEALKWNESDWGSRPDHLNDIFHEIDEEKDVRTQLTEQE